MSRADRHQPASADRFVGPLDAHPFRFSQHDAVLDQPCGRFRQHHPARRRHRFHPLRHPDLLADYPVAQRPRTDLTGNYPTGIEAHPQPQSQPIAALHVGCQPVRFLLDGHCGQATPKRVIFQRHWGTEECHQPVAGVLHAPAAVTLHDRRRALHQLGHDFAQPLHIHRGRDLHRTHHVGEQHRHLLELRCVTRDRGSGAARVTEPGVLPQPSAA